jgi:integrase
MTAARASRATGATTAATEPTRSFDYGAIRLLAPTGVGTDIYWRLEWYDHDGSRCQTTGGRTKRTARIKADRILARLEARVQPEGRVLLGAALEQYIRWVKANKSFNHWNCLRRELPNLLGRLRDLRCEDLDLRRLRSALNASSTKIVAAHHKSRVKVFLWWGKGQGYFTMAQTKLLEDYEYVPDKDPVLKPSRRSGARVSGEAARVVQADEVPVHDAVAAAGDALGERIPAWGKLYVELMAADGARLGEHLAVSASSVDLDLREIRIERQVLIRTSAYGERTDLPKGNKIRATVFAEVTPTGYHLSGALEKRLIEVEHEHEAGTNPRRLLFPAQHGGFLWPGAFTNDHFVRACLAAGWEQLKWEEVVVRGGKSVTIERHQMRHTQHSLRHRFARDQIDLYRLMPEELLTIGGWESMEVVWARYYGRSKDALDRVRAKTASR